MSIGFVGFVVLFHCDSILRCFHQTASGMFFSWHTIDMVYKSQRVDFASLKRHGQVFLQLINSF